MRRYFKIAPSRVAAAMSSVPARENKIHGEACTNKAGNLAIASPETKVGADEMARSPDATELTLEEARDLRAGWDNEFAPPAL